MSSQPILSHDDDDTDSEEIEAPVSDDESERGVFDVGVEVTEQGVLADGEVVVSSVQAKWEAVKSRVGSFMVAPLLPDDLAFKGKGVPTFHVKLAKFMAVSLCLFFLSHWLVRANDWSHNQIYDVEDWLLYDCSSCVLDLFWFFW
jgi:hypothetical protein